MVFTFREIFLCLVVAGAEALRAPVAVGSRPAVGRHRRPGGVVVRSDPFEEAEEEALEPRLSTTSETLAAFALGAAGAALGGVEILDAGWFTSALLAGAAVGFAAENEKDYGVGDVARGIGKMGWKAFQAANASPEAAKDVANAASDKADDFNDRIKQIRRDLAADKKKAEAAPPRFADVVPAEPEPAAEEVSVE